MTSFIAHVVPGKKRGRKIGYPTVNLEVSGVPVELQHGIYAVWATMDNGQWTMEKIPAVVHYGAHPAFKDTRVTFEVHVLEGMQGKQGRMMVEIVQKIRDIKDFPDVASLREQIARDCAAARAILGLPHPRRGAAGLPMMKRLKASIGQRSPVRLAWHAMKTFAAALRYGFPARKLTVIGVTGTDGKTTTVGMIAHILNETGIPVGAASTAFFRVKDEIRENPTHLTSIDPFTLQRFLRRLVSKGCTHAVLEMSSHGLVQRRTSYTWPRVAAITNTALEHLDYHVSMEQYRRDKGLLFRMLRGKGVKVLNAEDETYGMYRRIPSVKTCAYGRDNGQWTMDNDVSLWITDAKVNADGCTATVHKQEGSSFTAAPLTLTIPGAFNLENALCAIGCSDALGVDVAEACRALRSFPGIPGRLEQISEGQPFSVFVDFAVSPQAYERTLQALRAIVGAGGRVLVLCSSCGNRMREKRPEIGRICSTLADVLVATEDETYGEDPHAVLEQVWSGVDTSKGEAHKIFDRREAIRFLLREARSGDAVVLCGMGPFTTMTKLEGRVPWDERQVARDILRELRTFS